jgi:hypothetical protein
MNHVIPSPSTPPKATKLESFIHFLTQTGWGPLIILGSAIRSFGWRIPIGIFLGIASVYGYALFRPVPYFPNEHKEPENIKLSGKVLVRDTEPLKEPFKIGILESEHGPFDDPQGLFSIDVPLKDRYTVLVWGTNYQPIRLYTRNRITVGNEYSLDRPLSPFPTHLGILVGEVNHNDRRPFDGIVEVAGKNVRVDNGKFEIKDVPLGKSLIKFKEGPSGRILHKEEITLELDSPTPKEFIVP